MIRRLGVSIASLAVVAACVAAAFSPHERGSPPTIGESTITPAAAVVSDAVLREPMITLHPLAAVYVFAERASSAPIPMYEPVAETPATRSLSFDRLRDNSLSTWRSHECDGSLPCNRNDASTFLARRQL